MSHFAGIKAILIDADDTLFCVAPSVSAIYLDEVLKHGIKADEKSVSSALKSSWVEIKPSYENKSNGYITFEVRERELWREFSRRVVSVLTNGLPNQNLLDSIYERFARGASRKLHHDAIEFLNQAKAMNLGLGVFTNNDKRINQVLSELGVKHYFDKIISSDLLGFKKPALEAFKRVEELFGLKPSEMLLIGNSYEHDILGAASASWNAVMLEGPVKPFSTSQKIDTNLIRVSSFLEVLPLIKPTT